MTVPEFGLNQHRISRDHLLIVPPLLPYHSEWERADGRVARFSFSPRFFEAVADQMGLPAPRFRRFWHAFFAIDQQLEALCRLLVEETEARCSRGPLYFESLARALLAGVLCSVRDQHLRKLRNAVVPPGIHRVIESLETNFADDFSLTELAAQAQLSRSHFAQTFRQFTGHSPHQYLLRVRLDHARKMLAQENQIMSLAEVAAASGFFDQAHLSRHFRHFFGTTPAAFQRRQSRA